MARFLARTTTFFKPQTRTLTRSFPPSLLSPSRAKSSRAGKASFIEIDIGSSGSGSETEVEVHLGAKRLEDVLHGIYAQRSAPDWLPFVPGSSYWVPPKSKKTAVAAADFVRLVKTMSVEPLTQEEAMSFKTARGWPSSAYFVEGIRAKKEAKKAAIQSDDDE